MCVRSWLFNLALLSYYRLQWLLSIESSKINRNYWKSIKIIGIDFWINSKSISKWKQLTSNCSKSILNDFSWFQITFWRFWLILNNFDWFCTILDDFKRFRFNFSTCWLLISQILTISLLHTPSLIQFQWSKISQKSIKTVYNWQKSSKIVENRWKLIWDWFWMISKLILVDFDWFQLIWNRFWMILPNQNRF